MEQDPAPRFLSGTRGQVVRALRRGPRTVAELAHGLGVTPNAVRAHLATLERDGFVRRSGVRRGTGKPAHIYELGQRAPELFAKAHERVLGELLATLDEEAAPDELDRLLERTGERIGRELGAAGGDLGMRVEAAAAALRELGGLVDVDATDDGYEIRGHDCPLGDVAVSHPEICRVVETLLAKATGASVQERCAPGSSTPCTFRVVGAEASSA